MPGRDSHAVPVCSVQLHPSRWAKSLAGTAARTHSLVASLLWCLALGLLSQLAPFVSRTSAADITLPEIDPQYAIHVDAETYASVQRGAYDVLAFEGKCTLTQGQLKATADEIILWIERSTILNTEYQGKVVCYMNGNVRLDWGDGRGLQDHRWTGRLFSLKPVSVDSGRPVVRYDIPNLDWGREPYPFQLTQFNQSSPSASDAAVLVAPPLLGQSSPDNTGLLPPPQAPTNQAPATPGAVQWNPGATGSTIGGTRNMPPGGFVLPEDGSSPYPAGSRNNLPVAPEPQTNFAPAFPQETTQVVQQVPTPSPFAAKSVRFFPRGSNPPDITLEPYDPNRGESILQIRGGFKLVVQGIQVTGADGQVTEYGTVSLEADNAVVWVRSDGPVNPLEGFSSTADRPIELYLEGNIVFLQGQRVVYAERMYYNVSSEYGMVLSAEVLTPVPQYQGLMRLKADVLQQLDSKNYKAFGAAVTSSRLAVPRYWLQSGELEFQDNRTEDDLSVFAPTDANRPTDMRLTSRGNHAYLAGIPIFYWPTFNTNLREPSFYLRSIKFKNDTIFGFQTYADWNLYQLLGINGPEGTQLNLSTDYLSDRGPALGARFDYNRPTWLFGAPGYGFTDAWFIKDSGLDILGIDRINLTPEEEYRGRLLSRHRIFFSPNLELIAESGWISDRDFLEQYFENEWEQDKDFATELRLRRYNGNRMFQAYGRPRTNDFFTETEWLPRMDHYWLGQDLLAERVTWSAHTHVGYGHQRTATTPIDPQNAATFALLPWETDSEGVRFGTRHEVSAPFSLGAFKLAPFLSGEVAYWKEDINQDDVVRLTGQAGIRSSLPMWSVNPNIENRLLDLRGLAHKVNLETEFFYADSNQDLDQLPLYDPLDDNAQEHFRRRFIFNTFGGALPPEFDERQYALRSGMQRWVTAGSAEIVDDLTQVRVGFNHRWQTKRGLPGQERIVDLVSLNTDFIFYPKADRDNFGEDVGAMTYDFRYNVGDRLTLLSDGYFDVFSQGLKAVSAGAQISRPGRGDLYIGMLSLEGPISANILNGYVNYRMNEKWILTGGSAFDFGDTGTIGQSLSLTRIGESALVRVGVNVDSGRDNVSFNFNIEPRFLQTGRLGMLGGELVPPAGLFGIE